MNALAFLVLLGVVIVAQAWLPAGHDLDTLCDLHPEDCEHGLEPCSNGCEPSGCGPHRVCYTHEGETVD